MMPAGLWLRPEHYGGRGLDAAARLAAVHEEARNVRQNVGLIDVSTLGGLELRGPDAATMMERMYTWAYRKQQVGRARYTLMTDMTGIVTDDGVACRLHDQHFYVTATTSGVDGVYREMLFWNAQWRLRVDVTHVTGAWAGVNLAGPKSRQVLARLTDQDLSAAAFPYMGVREAKVAGIPCRLLRVGFVGELGFEIHCPCHSGEALWDALMAAVVEHLATLHGHEVPEWVNERERFLDVPWIVSRLPLIRQESLAFAPAAFIRHGALPDPRDLDARGGERHAWAP